MFAILTNRKQQLKMLLAIKRLFLCS